MPASNYLRNKLYDHVLRATPYTAPATVYCALYSTDPTAADVGTELTGNGYTRKAVTFGAPTNGAGQNNGVVTFDAATGDWVTATHYGIRDASSGGNLLIYNALTAPKTVSSGETPRIPIGNLQAAVT